MKLFLDTNIIIDFLANRKPFSNYAYQIFVHQKYGKFELWASSHSVTTAYYILEKELGEAKTRTIISKFLNKIHIKEVDKIILKSALDSKFKDFEDGVQFFCAFAIGGIYKIVTRNLRDFKPSTIECVTSEELFI